MNTLLDIKDRARSLCGDPDGDFMTDGYLLPLINQGLDEAVNYLEGSCSPFIEEVIEVLNVPAGTTSLVVFQRSGGVLAGLVNPLNIEVKPAGAPPNQYGMTDRTDKLPHVNPATGVAPFQRGSWEYRSFIVYLTPFNYATDISVRGEFRPRPLLKDEDYVAVHPMIVAALAFKTAELVGMERGNPGYVQNYGPKATATLDDIAAELGRQQQGTSSRVGRASGRGGRRR